jgi:putative transposase
MSASRFTEEQIRYAVQPAETGLPVPELCREYGVAPATFYRGRQKYGALTKSELARRKELERENGRPKKLVAELTLDKQIAQDVVSRKDGGPDVGASTCIAWSRAIGSANAWRVSPWGGPEAVIGAGAGAGHDAPAVADGGAGSPLSMCGSCVS